ncbi:mCG148326 [Mus musculus]|nr:mCG148326 [Mus musculus]
MDGGARFGWAKKPDTEWPRSGATGHNWNRNLGGLCSQTAPPHLRSRSLCRPLPAAAGVAEATKTPLHPNPKPRAELRVLTPVSDLPNPLKLLQGPCLLAHLLKKWTYRSCLEFGSKPETSCSKILIT